MTDLEVICAWMADPNQSGYWGRWWSVTSSDDGAMFKSPKKLDLNDLWEVEEKLTEQQWHFYESELATALGHQRLSTRHAIIHATAEHKILALARVLRVTRNIT